MDISKVLAGLQRGLAAAKSITGIAAELGIPEASIANSLVSIAQNVEQRIADGTIVATSTDHEQIKAIIVSLQAENDALNAFILAN